MNDVAIDLKILKKEFEARSQQLHEDFQQTLGAIVAIDSERAAIARNEGIDGEWRIVNSEDLRNYIENLGVINTEISKYDWPDEIGRPQKIVGQCQKLIVQGSFCCTDKHPLPKVDFRFCEFY